MRVVVPLPLPNKANTYQVHFAHFFWDAIKDIVAGIRNKGGFRGKLYWVAPSEEVRSIERDIGFFALRSMPDDWNGPVRLDVWISDRLDWDAVKAISDGIQKSGRIKNDTQIKIGTVVKLPIKNDRFAFNLTVMTEDEWLEYQKESLSQMNSLARF